MVTKLPHISMCMLSQAESAVRVTDCACTPARCRGGGKSVRKSTCRLHHRPNFATSQASIHFGSCCLCRRLGTHAVHHNIWALPTQQSQSCTTAQLYPTLPQSSSTTDKHPNCTHREELSFLGCSLSFLLRSLLHHLSRCAAL